MSGELSFEIFKTRWGVKSCEKLKRADCECRMRFCKEVEEPGTSGASGKGLRVESVPRY